MKLSIIIPCLNEAHNIVDTLLPLQALRQRGHEIILSDGGSTDNTLELARPFVDLTTNASVGRANQMNAGAQLASGEVLCFLHADTLVPNNIDELILTPLNKSFCKWGFFHIRLSGTRWQFRVIEWLINQRSCISQVATGDQGMFVLSKNFKQLAGFANIPLMEDIEISKRLKCISKPLCIKNTQLITSSRRWEKHGINSTIILMWELRLRYFLGSSPSTLVKAYHPHAAKK